MLRMVDDQIRRFVEHLDALGVTEDTIVFFVSDHGDYVGDYGLQRKGAGMPEALMRIPFIVLGPGVRARVDDVDHVSLADVLPTVCDIIGRPIPLGVQGRSLWPLLSGEEYSEEDFASVYAERGFGGLPYQGDARPRLHFPYEGTTYDELNTVTQSGSSAMVRAGRWKLVYDLTRAGELYDLDQDPMELVNRWDDGDLAEVRADLVETMLWWRLRVSDDLPEGRYTTRRAAHGWVIAQLRTPADAPSAIRGDVALRPD
jgi:arylsulfatase A-like enzyme